MQRPRATSCAAAARAAFASGVHASLRPARPRTSCAFGSGPLSRRIASLLGWNVPRTRSSRPASPAPGGRRRRRDLRPGTARSRSCRRCSCCGSRRCRASGSHCRRARAAPSCRRTRRAAPSLRSSLRRRRASGGTQSGLPNAVADSELSAFCLKSIRSALIVSVPCVITTLPFSTPVLLLVVDFAVVGREGDRLSRDRPSPRARRSRASAIAKLRQAQRFHVEFGEWTCASAGLAVAGCR